ncbi:MAG TPA: hypothetical protein VHQ90_14895 [Thermoanaerobaculia bacterium]|nr:hypothetical protein [Thermoanaerobaculia bacterium]
MSDLDGRARIRNAGSSREPSPARTARWLTRSLAILALVASSPAARAQSSQPQGDAGAPDAAALRQEITALKQAYEQRLAELEKRIATLEAANAAAGAAAPVPAAGAETPGAPGGGGSQTSNYFNPSVSVIGNFLGVAGKNHVATLPTAALRESELGLQAVVDPYMRADFFISFGEHDVSVEEGFATFTSLSGGLLAKVGRMRAGFGKINTLHLHVLPWPDEPLTVVNLLGGEEGWIGTGVSVARLFPLPGDTFSEATVQVFEGTAAGLFEAKKRSDLAYNGHYRVFRDLTESTNLDLGLSYGVGHNGTTDSALTRLEGTDFTLRWKPLQHGNYRSASLRGEVIRSRRDQPGGRQTAVGWFLSGEYQLAKRWFVGARLEAAERAADAARRDTGQAMTLTFWPSEFSQLRGELRRRHYSLRDTANELLLQLQFAIGAHGAHPF